MSSTLYGLAVEMVAVMSLWLGLSVWQRDRRTPGSLLFAGLIASVLVWCLGLVLAEHGLVDLETRGRIIWAGVLALPPLWLGVAAHASGLALAGRVPWFPAALMLPSVLLYALLFAGPWEHLFLVHDGTVGNEGPLFPLWIAWSYVLVLGGVILFVRAAFRWPRQGIRRRAVTLGVAVLIPIVGNALYVFGDTGLGEDPTPVLVGLAILPLRAAIFHGGLFDVLPVDQRDLLLRLPVGIVLAEPERGVIEMNRRAEEILGIRRSQAMGRGLACLVVTRRGDDASRSSLHAA